MNKTCYELQQLHTITVDSSNYPICIDIADPTVIIPDDTVSVISHNDYFEVEKGKLLTLTRAESDVQIFSRESGRSINVYCLSFNCYKLIEKTDARIIYERNNEWLPQHGTVRGLPRRVYTLLDSIIEQYKIKLSDSTSAKLEALIHDFLYNLFERMPICHNHDLEQHDTIRKVLSYLHTHFDDPITRSDIAQMFGFNSSYFSSLFRKKTGWNFNEYVARLRLEEAKRLLLSTGDTYHEIANKVGMLDGNYLGKSFRKLFHITPSKYRELRYATQIAALQFPGALLAVGIVPVAVTTEVLRSAQLIATELNTAAKINVFESLEDLKAIKPEFIVAPTYLYNFPRLINEIEQIAPTVMLEWGALDKLEEVRLIGSLLGREQQAETWIDNYLEKVSLAQQWRETYIPAGHTAAIYEHWRESSWMIPHITVRSAYNLYTSIGFDPPISIAQKSTQLKNHLLISDEELLDYSANYMFIIMPAQEHERFLASLQEREIWKTLVNKGVSIHLLDFYQFWLDEGVLLEKQLDVLMNCLSNGAWSKQFSL